MQTRVPSPLTTPRRAALPGTLPAAAAKPASPKATPHMELFAAAARRLGADETAAAEIGRHGTLAFAERTAVLMPLPDRDDGRLGTLLILETGRGCQPDQLTAVLGHAPGVLASFNASIGLSPQGQWLLYRVVAAPAGDTQLLADAVAGSLALVDFVFGDETPAAH